MRRPNFFIVGAPKCGTSSMWRYLDQHPDVFMSAWKEPHYFSRTDLPSRKAGWGVDSEEQYLRLFSDAKRQSRVGEASTWYLYSSNAPAAIHRFAPDAKIVCMLRDPVEMVCSMFHQNVSNGNEDLTDLAEALAAEPDRHRGERLPARAPYPPDFHYFESARYAPQVARYFEQFGRERVLVLLFDDLKTDTAAVYRRTLDFLDLEDFQVDFSVVNAKRAIRNVTLRRFLIGRPRLTATLDRFVPADLRGAIGRTLACVNPASAVQPVMADQTRASLRERFLPDVEELERMLGRDLEGWKTP